MSPRPDPKILKRLAAAGVPVRAAFQIASRRTRASAEAKPAPPTSPTPTPTTPSLTPPSSASAPPSAKSSTAPAPKASSATPSTAASAAVQAQRDANPAFQRIRRQTDPSASRPDGPDAAEAPVAAPAPPAALVAPTPPRRSTAEIAAEVIRRVEAETQAPTPKLDPPFQDLTPSGPPRAGENDPDLVARRQGNRDRREAAFKRLRAKLSQTNVGVDPEMVQIMVDVMASYIDDGSR